MRHFRSAFVLLLFFMVSCSDMVWPAFAADRAITFINEGLPAHHSALDFNVSISVETTDLLQGTRTVEVEPTVEKRLIGWVEYDTYTCRVIDTGTWRARESPSHGTLRYGRKNLTATDGPCAGHVFPYNYAFYTWTDTTSDATHDSFSLQWFTADGMFTDNSDWLVRIKTAKIDGADLIANRVDVTLSGLDSSGPLALMLIGDHNTFEVSFKDGKPVGKGTYSVTFDRPSIPEDRYTKIIAKWESTTGGVTSPYYRLRPVWRVLGIVRHSQYNTPRESACRGTPKTAWVFDGACNFTETTLDSKFASQVYINGSGHSTHHGAIKYSKKCSGSYPHGANARNAFLLVNDITGSCNRSMADTFQAAFPNPRSSSTETPKCGDTTVLVKSNNGTTAEKEIQDYCPACNDGHHIDNYTDIEACSGRDVGDLGDFWTANVGGR